jgi:hypothetical protein
LKLVLSLAAGPICFGEYKLNNYLKLCLAGIGVTGCVTANADALFFDSASFAGNAAMRASWLAASGVAAPDFMEDFEAFTVGTNVNGSPLAGGATVTHTTGNAFVQSSTGFFGGSNPVGTRSLAVGEGSTVLTTILFTAPVDYVGGLEIDKPVGSLTVVFTDLTTDSIALAATATSGNSAEFWGVYRNDAPQITEVRILAGNGGDGEHGVDNIEFGVVPEPSTIVVLGASLLGLAFLRRKK